MASKYSRQRLNLLLALCVVLPGVIFLWINSRHNALVERLQQDIRRLQSEERGSRASGGLVHTRERFDALQNQLQGRDKLPSRLDAMHRIAGGYGVKIGKASYQLRPADKASGAIGRYEIRLETEAAYYELRFFLRDLLAADPLLALESIELRRSASGSYNAGGKSILATLHIVMYFGATN